MPTSVRLDDGTVDFSVRLNPETLASSRALIQASSGGGKSYLLRLIVEKVGARLPVIVIDPEGEFHTVREVCSMILVGPGGELPAQAGTAGKVARGLLEHSCSAVIDLSELHTKEHSRYVADFLTAMMHAPRRLWRPTLVAIDEAHRFCPEGGRDNIASDPVIDLMSRGRKRGYGGLLLTQRISKIRKDAIAEASNGFLGRTTLDIDVKRSADMLGMPVKEAQRLRSLRAGDWFAYGPAIDADGVVQFPAALPRTAPPKPGQASAPVKGARSLEAIAGMVEEVLAQDDTPITLEEAESTIRALRQDLVVAKRSSGPSEADLKRSYDDGWAEGHTNCREQWNAHSLRIGDSVDAAEEFAAASHILSSDVVSSIEKLKEILDQPLTRDSPNSHPTIKSSAPTVRSFASSRVSGSSQARMLHALAWWAQVGEDDPTIEQIAFVAGISPRSSTIRGARAALKSEGMIEYTSGGTKLTEAGRAAAPDIKRPPDLAAWHASIREQLGGGVPRKVFDELLSSRDPLYQGDVASRIMVSPKSSTIRGAVAALRKLRLVQSGNPLRLSDIAFPPGLN